MCGFTLIEMMVTIGIGAILLAITVSSYSDLRERTRVETANNFFIRLNEVTGRVSIVDTRINALTPPHHRPRYPSPFHGMFIPSNRQQTHRAWLFFWLKTAKCYKENGTCAETGG